MIQEYYLFHVLMEKQKQATKVLKKHKLKNSDKETKVLMK